MTLQTLADMVGTTAQTIQRLETDNMTVSVDWLKRIGNALDMPPAQLLVGEMGQTVPLVGLIGSDGSVRQVSGDVRDSMIISVPGDDPIAVKLAERLGPYDVNTILIATRLEKAAQKRADGRDCIVQLAGGRMVFRRIVHARGGPSAFVPYEDRAGVERNLDIVWVAPVVMVVRYLSN